MRATSFLILLPVLACFPVLASAQIVTSHVPDDATLRTLLPTPAFVAEGRIGDRSGAATFELDLGPDTSAPAVMAQYDWQSGVPEDFTLTYDGVGLVTFSLGGYTLEYTPVLLDLVDIFVRARATQVATEMLVNDLVLDGEVINDQSFASPPNDPDILRIQGGVLEDGFVLTGTATMTWIGDPPRNSHLAFQIKVGEPEVTVPVAPSTWGQIKELFH
jgi:hypothetical protein